MHVPQNIIGCGPPNFYVETSRMCRYLEDTFWADSVARPSTRRQIVCALLRMYSRFRKARKQVRPRFGVWSQLRFSSGHDFSRAVIDAKSARHVRFVSQNFSA
jgi:hypothetical protein